MKSLAGKVAAVTGAGSGIGQAVAVELAKQGCHLALADVDQNGLTETQAKLAGYNVNVSNHLVDVAKKEAVYQFADDVVATHGKVNIIINNAGVGLGETVENMKYENFEWLMNINFWGVVYGTKAFMPFMRQTDEGHIVNISSIFGMIGVPTQSAYNAAKFAVRGFTESLREELEIDGGNISATSVHPGGIKTNIARNSRMGDMGKVNRASKDEAVQLFDKMARTSPEAAAKKIVQGIKKNKRRVLIGADAHVIDSVQRLFPTRYQKLLEAGFRRA